MTNESFADTEKFNQLNAEHLINLINHNFLMEYYFNKDMILFKVTIGLYIFLS